MRHFLNTLSDCIENGETGKAQEYILEIIASTDKTARKKYSTNETINMILSSYETELQENDIDFHCQVRVPGELPISDVELTSILSNAMENAIHAAASIEDPAQRLIELTMNEAGGKLLISLENTCSNAPHFAGGLPVTSEPGHELRHSEHRLHRPQAQWQLPVLRFRREIYFADRVVGSHLSCKSCGQRAFFLMRRHSHHYADVISYRTQNLVPLLSAYHKNFVNPIDILGFACYNETKLNIAKTSMERSTTEVRSRSSWNSENPAVRICANNTPEL